jgi:HK97 family phage major capsid protein
MSAKLNVIIQKRNELKELFDKNTATAADGSKSYNLSADQLKEVNDRNDELNKLQEEHESEVKAAEIAAQNAKALDTNRTPDNRILQPGEGKGKEEKPEPFNLRKALSDNPQIKAAMERYKSTGQMRFEANLDVEMKTLVETTAGFAPFVQRQSRVEEYPLRQLVVADLMPNTPTSESAIKYMRETTHTSGAAEVAEGAVKGEAALVWTEITDPVQKIAVWIPVTEEQLADVPGMESLIQNRLAMQIMQREDLQILVGNGTAPNISGILDRTGIQTQALGADVRADAIFKAMTKVRGVSAGTGFAEPDAVVIHPNDWEPIRLLRTTDGIYIWGPPSEAGPQRIWGKPVVVTPAITENTALVGAFRQYSELFRRTGIVLKATDSHSDYFIYNKLVLLAEERIALAVYRETAFCSVTGL